MDSLGRTPQIQARLQLEIMEIREEIAQLKAQLMRDQDPERMQLIQALIGVSMEWDGSSAWSINLANSKATHSNSFLR